MDLDLHIPHCVIVIVVLKGFILEFDISHSTQKNSNQHQPTSQSWALSAGHSFRPQINLKLQCAPDACNSIVGVCFSVANNDISDGAETARINEIRAITCDASTSFIYFADKDSTSNNYVLRRVNIDIIYFIFDHRHLGFYDFDTYDVI